MNIQTENRKVQAGDESLDPCTRQAEAAEEGHWRNCSVEVSLRESGAGMILALLCPKQGEKGGDILDSACKGSSNRHCDKGVRSPVSAMRRVGRFSSCGPRIQSLDMRHCHHSL